MRKARRSSGVVMPAIHLGTDRSKLDDEGKMLVGMDYAPSTTPPGQLDGSCYWVPDELHEKIVDAILTQLKRAGLRTGGRWLANGRWRERTTGSTGPTVPTTIRSPPIR